MKHGVSPALAQDLVLDELFDLTLYQELARTSKGATKNILEQLVPVETGHLTFWQNFFDLRLDKLNFMRRVKLGVLVFACRIFGENAVHLVLEAIEIYGVKKYLWVWESYRGQPLGEAVKDILTDEFEHEDTIVLQMAERKINPAKIRSIFLGFNDGLVEILGAVSGFFAAFNQTSHVLIAASTVAFAGAASMAAGAFVATGSEGEMEKVELGKQRFLGKEPASGPQEKAGVSAGIVGVSYLFGAAVPVFPVFFGADSPLAPFLTAAVFICFVSMILAFLSGMHIRKRIVTNLLLMAAAVGISYLIGNIARSLWGISI